MDFKGIIKAVAPFIGTLIGGPFGGIATTILSKVFTGKENSTQEEIEKAVSTASPEQFVELKRVDLEKKKEYLKAGVKLEEIAALDRNSARDMQKSTNSIVPGLLTIIITVGFFVTTFCIAYVPMQSTAKDVIDIMLGAEVTAWISCVMFWFGSSAGSKLKTMIMDAKGK